MTDGEFARRRSTTALTENPNRNLCSNRVLGGFCVLQPVIQP
jgi:hypothetical protein